MGKISQVIAIIIVGIILVPVVKEVLDLFFDTMVIDLPGLTAFESLVMRSYPYAIVLGIIVGIFLTIREDPRKRR